MTDTIPDAVIEAMKLALTHRREEDPGIPEEGIPPTVLVTTPTDQQFRAALAAAEKLGWRLCPREPTDAMRCRSTFEAAERWWPAMWDAAPKS